MNLPTSPAPLTCSAYQSRSGAFHRAKAGRFQDPWQLGAVCGELRLVADLELDTRVTGEHGRYRANISRDWEIWGPNGGYIAGLALRAASRETPLSRPASFYCQYLNVAEFAEVSLSVTKLRESKRSCALRVSMTQGERPILEALTWLTDEANAGLEHDETTAPDAPGPDGLPSFEELRPSGYPWYSF
jgi:hypothetical protein